MSYCEEEIELVLLNESHHESIIKILNEDQLLKMQLYQSHNNNHLLELKEYLEILNAWYNRNQGYLYTIMAGDRVIGSTSLCDLNLDNHSARTGVWIASDCWNKGVSTIRLRKLMEIAKSKSIYTLKCKIKKDNKASKRVWEKLNATFFEDDQFFYAELLVQ